MGGDIQRRVDPQPDAAGTGSRLQQRLERAERLGVHQGAGGKGGREFVIGLAHAVDHDPLGRRAGSKGQGQLDRPDDLAAEPVGGEAVEQRRVRVGLDGVRDQGTRQCLAPGVRSGARRVEIRDVQRCPPSLGGLAEQRFVHGAIVGR